jgi:hypothetical protein
LIRKTVSSWFVRVESLKERLLKNNKQTHWCKSACIFLCMPCMSYERAYLIDPMSHVWCYEYHIFTFTPAHSYHTPSHHTNSHAHRVPSSIRDGRFHNWLQDARDWAISVCMCACEYCCVPHIPLPITAQSILGHPYPPLDKRRRH